MTAEMRKGDAGSWHCGWRETEHVEGPNQDTGDPWADGFRRGGDRAGGGRSVLRGQKRAGLVGQSGFQGFRGRWWRNRASRVSWSGERWGEGLAGLWVSRGPRGAVGPRESRAGLSHQQSPEGDREARGEQCSQNSTAEAWRWSQGSRPRPKCPHSSLGGRGGAGQPGQKEAKGGRGFRGGCSASCFAEVRVTRTEM